MPREHCCAPNVRVDTRRLKTRGFTLIDLLVSLSIIALLIGLLLPSISTVRETSRRVVCSSNIRQIGLALAMYADDDRREMLPTSLFDAAGMGQRDDSAKAQEKLAVRVDDGSGNFVWDGIGLLFDNYLAAPGVFYCPSHTGEHPVSRYSEAWFDDDQPTQVVSNFQYRGTLNGRPVPFYRLPESMAILTDGLRTRRDYNHSVGSNVLRADNSVGFRSDESTSAIIELLPLTESDLEASEKISQIWGILDAR